MLFLEPNAENLAWYFRELCGLALVWTNFSYLNRKLYQSTLLASCSPSNRFPGAVLSKQFFKCRMCLSGACEQAEACYESGYQVQKYLLASLDSFPCWRELYENTIFTNSCFLIKVNEAPGPLNHSFLIKGQPLKQKQDCLKLFFFKCCPLQTPLKNTVCFISIYMPIAGFCSQRYFLDCDPIK